MKAFLKTSLSLLALITMAACEKASDTVINIPNVRVGCTTTNDPDCSNSNPGLTAYVRMSRSGCGSSLGFDPVATGSVVLTCDSSGCEGTISTWTNPDTSEPITEILTGFMDVCSQVDLNNSSNLPDTGDLINEDSRNISTSSTITVDTWTTQ